jgi:hypothetical protein
MPSLFKFVLAVFACYRLAQLIALDDGPYSVFDRLRKELGWRAANENVFWQNMAELFHCPFCLGIWFAIPLAFYVGEGIIEIVIAWLAIAGAQAFLQGVNYDAE